MKETIAVIELERAVEEMRKRKGLLSSVEGCKLRSLEMNLQILKAQQGAERAQQFLAEFDRDFTQQALRCRERIAAAVLDARSAALTATTLAREKRRRYEMMFAETSLAVIRSQRCLSRAVGYAG